MAIISVDYNSSANEIYLAGDIKDLKRNRFAWRYISDYLLPIEQDNRIIVPVGEREVYSVLADVGAMLKKYGFTETMHESSEQVLQEYYAEEQRFKEFSKQALNIRNNYCNPVEFQTFSDSVIKNLPARSLYPLQLLSAYHMAFSQNACNFSVPGAGKTRVGYGAYAYLHNLPEDDAKRVDKMLIIGPLSSFGPWELEYEECFGRKPRTKRLGGGINRAKK